MKALRECTVQLEELTCLWKSSEWYQEVLSSRNVHAS